MGTQIRLVRPAIVWVVAVLFSLLVIVGALGSVSYFVTQARVQTQRRYDSCLSRQRLYDGQILLVNFLADEFHATQAQRDEGLRALHKKIHERPTC